MKTIFNKTDLVKREAWIPIDLNGRMLAEAAIKYFKDHRNDNI